MIYQRPWETKAFFHRFILLDFNSLLGFAIVSFSMVISPGPNMMYLISRSISQGRLAGAISLLGVLTAFIVYFILSATGINALFKQFPISFVIIKYTGALYILYLAWNAIKPNGKSIFEFKNLEQNSPLELYFMGFMTNLLNPKAIILYVTLLPQFIEPKLGHEFVQFIQLGAIQFCMTGSINLLIVLTAGSIAKVLTRNEKFIQLQKIFTGFILLFVALKIAFEHV